MWQVTVFTSFTVDNGGDLGNTTKYQGIQSESQCSSQQKNFRNKLALCSLYRII